MSKSDELFWKKLAKKFRPEELADAILTVTHVTAMFEDNESRDKWKQAVKTIEKVPVERSKVLSTVKAELEKSLDKYSKGNWDEADALDDLFAKGYTLDDFHYDSVRYEWAKTIAEEHGLI